MDDFFLRPEQRTPERFSEIGGNIDRERFLKEVLLPLSNNHTVQYRRFDCSSMQLKDPVSITPTRLTVIEGAYSMHPALAPYYDFSIFLDISCELQKERILKRNSSAMAVRFFNEWIPLEQKYFSEMKIKKQCNLTIVIHE
jgi:uridine kinase